MAVLVSDSFDRANNGDLGSAWDVMTSENAWNISGNTAIPSSLNVDCTESNNSVTWPNDQYAQAVLGVCAYSGSGTDVGVGVAVRCATGARTFYRGLAAGSTKNNTEIGRMVAGSHTTLATAAASWVAGDTIYMSMSGTTIQMKRNGTDLVSTTDASAAAGRVGVSYSSAMTSSVALASWEGGDLAAEAFTPIISHLVENIAVQRAAVY